MNEVVIQEDTSRTVARFGDVLAVDRFEQPVAPGHVIGSRASSGATRLGVDRPGTLSVDHGQLRMGWFEHAGWGQVSLAYGPFELTDGLALAVRAMNGLTTSQTDPRPEGRRAMLRRWRATAPWMTVRRPQHRESFMLGWFGSPVVRRRPSPIAAVVHRAGDGATGELWFEAGARRVRVTDDLQNLPARYVVTLRDGVASLFAWSYPGAPGSADPDDSVPVARIELAEEPPAVLYAAIHQIVLGEVRYRLDTRIDEVVLARCAADEAAAAVLIEDRRWQPTPGAVTVRDTFAGQHADLDGTSASGSARWARVLGDGAIDRTGDGRARVRASREHPNPGRTVYCLPWDGATGVQASVTITPPGDARGQGHRGRSGLVIWQDPDNHLILNHFLDDGSIGVSISAFLRTGGREEMFEWDAVWSNVGRRVTWGHPFRLSVACDGTQFLCAVDGEPVLYRALTDYRVDAGPLLIRGVGIGANWEWGDDTGTTFEDFTASPIRLPAERHDQPAAFRAARLRR